MLSAVKASISTALILALVENTPSGQPVFLQRSDDSVQAMVLVRCSCLPLVG